MTLATSWRRRLGVLVTSASLALLGVSFGAAEAHAHTGDLAGVAVCQADGTYKAPVKLTTAKVPAGNSGSTKWKLGTTSFQGTPTSAAGMDRGPVVSVGNTTVTLGTLTFPGTTNGSPWVYAYTTWSPDGFARGSDGQVTGMDGSCKAPLIDVTPNAPTVVQVCGPNDDLVTTTEQPAGLKLVSSGTWSGNKRSVIYEATEGYQPKAGNGFTVNDKGQLVLELTDSATACPVTTTDQCVTTVGFPTDAVVYADVHTAADSPVDNIITSGPFTVNTQFTVAVPTENYKFTVIRIVAKDGTVLKTQQVTSTTACNTVIPNNPGPRTVTGAVQKGAANCTTHEVEQFRIDTTIPQVWDATAKVYVDDPDKTHWTTVRVDLPVRPMTPDEVKACPVPDVKQCVTTVGFPTDAVVYADVHTAADSPVDNIITSGPFTVNTQFTVAVPTENYKFTVIRIVAKDGTVLKTQQVTSTTACNTVIPNNPGPRTVTGAVQKGAANCTTHEVEQFRIDTTIPQVWDATAKVYVDDPDKTHWTTVRVDLPVRPMTPDEVKACPVPDVKQCVTTVGFPTDAVVYADVHTAADSPVDNVVTSGPFTVNTQFTVAVPTENYKFTVIRIVAKDGTVLKTQQVTSTTACNTVIPNNPGPRTVTGAVQKGAANCATHEVEQFRIDTTIPQTWDAKAGKYIDDPDKTHWTPVRVDLPSRPMTADEVKACPVDTTDQLPHTGSDVGPALWVGVGLMACGILLWLFGGGRRRRAEG